MPAVGQWLTITTTQADARTYRERYPEDTGDDPSQSDNKLFYRCARLYLYSGMERQVVSDSV